MTETFTEILLVEHSPTEMSFGVHSPVKAALAARLEVPSDCAEAMAFIGCTGRHAQRNGANRPKVLGLDLEFSQARGLEILRRLKTNGRTRAIPVAGLRFSRVERGPNKSGPPGLESHLVKPRAIAEFAKPASLLGRRRLQHNRTVKP